MLKLEAIRHHWKQAGSFPAHLNLFGFWDEVSFLTKSGDLGSTLKISGVDYESLDHSGRDYVSKRLEAAFRTLSHKARLYQTLFRHNRPQISHQEYQDSLVQGAVTQRRAFLESKADHLYTIEIYWVLVVDGNYAKRSLLDALAELPKHPGDPLAN
jgi:type IV secretion system protein VirB4